MRLSGFFYEAFSAKKLYGEIELFRQSATIYSNGNVICSRIGIQSFQNRKDIYLNNGFLFTLEAPLAGTQEKVVLSDISRGINWLEKFSFVKASLLVIMLAFFVLFMRYSVNLFTPIVTQVFPLKWEQKIGKNTYNAFQRTILKKSNLTTFRIERLRNKAYKIASANGFKSPEILFHQSDIIGANAIAFPSGPIIITDDLVSLLQQDDLILGVIAHEFAHVQERHSLQHIVEIAGIVALASVILGSDDTLIEEASILGINLWTKKRSRSFEKEADLLALKYLEKAGLEKSVFLEAIQSLTAHYCSEMDTEYVRDCLNEQDSSWLSSHPTGAERIDYLSKTN